MIYASVGKTKEKSDQCFPHLVRKLVLLHTVLKETSKTPINSCFFPVYSPSLAVLLAYLTQFRFPGCPAKSLLLVSVPTCWPKCYCCRGSQNWTKRWTQAGDRGDKELCRANHQGQLQRNPEIMSLTTLWNISTADLWIVCYNLFSWSLFLTNRVLGTF